MQSRPADRIRWLRSEIGRHERLYYAEATPEISDREFDRLLAELQALEAAHPEFESEDSPTRRVGGKPLGEFRRAVHVVPMQSLDNTYSLGELENFLARLARIFPGEELRFCVEPKVDGVAISLVYEEGKFARAVTRGDGLAGDDVSQNLRTLRGIPHELAGGVPDLLEVRGEVYLPKARFVAINEERDAAGLAAFANPRNAAAGSLKQLDPSVVAGRGLQAIFYGLGAWEGGGKPATHLEFLEALRRWGFPVAGRVWNSLDASGVLAAVGELEGMRHDFSHEIDGAVVKLESMEQRGRAGSTAKAPRWAIAYKYEPERAGTRLLDITVQVGRTGVLTPVAELEPVFLSGSTIARATLHNEEEVRRKDIRIGDRVEIEKAGEVIPAVVGVLTELRDGSERIFEMPKFCPSCGAPVYRAEGFVAVRCGNFECPAQAVSRIAHFASRKALNIDGVGDVVAEALVAEGLVSSPLDLFSLDEERLAALPLGDAENPRRLGSKTARTILDALDAARSLPLARWLHAMGIPEIGEATARELARFHKDWRALLGSELLPGPRRLEELRSEGASALREDPIPPDDLFSLANSGEERFDRALAEYAKLLDRLAATGFVSLSSSPTKSSPPGASKKRTLARFVSFTCKVGPVACASLLAFLESPAGRAVARRMEELALNPSAGPGVGEQVAGPLAGKSLVITGTLSKPRAEIAGRIEAAGGKVTGAVSKNTDWLLAGEGGGSKLRDAHALGIPILSESEFFELLDGTHGNSSDSGS